METQHIKVLLIEDNPGDARLIQEMLAEARGVIFDLEFTDRLSTGLERIEIGDIDVVISDLSLPDSSGLDTFAEVHAQAPGVPIIVLSSLDDEEFAVKVVQEGAQDYLVKGHVDSNLLVRSIRYAIERKQGEEALRESEEGLRRKLESYPDAITVANLGGNILECNLPSLDLHGFLSKDEIIGKNAFEFGAKKDEKKAAKNPKKTLGQGFAKSFEYSFLTTKDGRELPGELSAGVIKGSAGSPISFPVITKDITERKQAEEQLILSEKLAGIGTLASGIAHEINNPLAGIMGYAEIIQNEENPDMRKRYSEKIVNNVERAANIVKWLSSYIRHAKDSNITDVDLSAVIDASLEALKHTKKSCDIEVVKDYQKIPTIKGNRSELQQIFVNLLNNAADAMPNGGKLSFSTTMGDGFVKVKVSDNGAGIRKEHINRIFEPFFTTKEVGEGTGLGLYVLSTIVNKHHGSVDVDSEVGKGTTFTLRFPIQKVRT